jgi:hypothetical protein
MCLRGSISHSQRVLSRILDLASIFVLLLNSNIRHVLSEPTEPLTMPRRYDMLRLHKWEIRLDEPTALSCREIHLK